MEKSDSAMVAVKRANKGASAPAEPVEPGAEPKGNPGGQSTRPGYGSLYKGNARCVLRRQSTVAARHARRYHREFRRQAGPKEQAPERMQRQNGWCRGRASWMAMSRHLSRTINESVLRFQPLTGGREPNGDRDRFSAPFLAVQGLPSRSGGAGCRLASPGTRTPCPQMDPGAARAAQRPQGRRVGGGSPRASSPHDPHPVRGEDHDDAFSAETISASPSARTTSGANPTSSSAAGKTRQPSRVRRRQSDTWLGRRSYRRATARTVAPGSSVSATIRAFNAAGQRRRPFPPQITSTRHHDEAWTGCRLMLLR